MNHSKKNMIMKKSILLAVLILLAATPARADWGAVFSDVSPSGHTLWFYVNYDLSTVTVTFPSGDTQTPYEGYARPTGTLVIPDTVSYYGDIYPVVGIGDNAFYGCGGLTSVAIPATVTFIDANAFRNCSRLASVNIPAAVTRIESGAFFGCSSLDSVAIPSGVAHIAQHLFSGCTNLVDVSLPDSLLTIGEYAFQQCSSLVRLVIPDAMYSIGNGAFNGCADLTSVTLGSAVKDIGSYAFSGCRGMLAMRANRSTPPLVGIGVFLGVPKGIPFYIPCGSRSDYQHADQWSAFTQYIEVGCTYSVTATTSDESMGHVTGGGAYLDGDTATLVATPHEGYRFDRWNDGVADNPRQVIVASDTLFTAYFLPLAGIDAEKPSRCRLYPNPATGRVTIQGLGEAILTVTILDMAGRPVAAFTPSGSAPSSPSRSASFTFDSSSLPPGSYIVQIQTPTRQHHQRLVRLN